ncbi:hypothetical protein NIE88_03175 [Sporolactobacillus shoreicorticis]|uniref:hypothetical protein n=1 Tax=Sporolactobacillus shoreicorticis TaxID=1923877 RepID=UPI002097AB01|nr:hypothetical protein [Sporolactobacillus shoreicorticis]MCO7124776.1 hypothetical protein [Sporolactobacillus shoreicorticis]
MNQALKRAGMQYQGTTEITHLLWLLLEDYGLKQLKEKVVRPLTGLTVADFYGCHILMPPQIMGFENPANPQSMEMVAEVLGAKIVNFDQ